MPTARRERWPCWPVASSRWFASSGTADTAGTPITESTRFRIASITKPIVAALVLDAVDRGEVALDDVVGDLLPGTVREDPPITVRQLLDHTSGVFDITNEQTTAESPAGRHRRLPDEQIRAEAQAALDGFLAGQQVIAPARVLVALSELHDRYFPPGSGYHYSNTGYQLAGMVLEEATGTSPDRSPRRAGRRATGPATHDTGPPGHRITGAPRLRHQHRGRVAGRCDRRSPRRSATAPTAGSSRPPTSS